MLAKDTPSDKICLAFNVPPYIATPKRYKLFYLVSDFNPHLYDPITGSLQAGFQNSACCYCSGFMSQFREHITTVQNAALPIIFLF